MAGCITEQEMKRIFKRFPDYSGIQTFVETGTFRAETISKMSPLFANCHSIELSRELYESARARFSSTPIHFHWGDSVKVLRELIPTIAEPAVFFLDAHFCGRESGKGEVDVPLLEEIRLIAARPYRDLLIIDDFRLFSTRSKEDWSGITVKNVLNCLSSKIPLWKRLIPRYPYSVANDRMIIAL